jgi:glycosyltransferase involved in cell wall biosynthesis
MTTAKPRLILHVINTLGLSGGAEQQLVANLDHFHDPTLQHHVAYLYGGDPRISWESSVTVPVTALNGTDETSSLLISGVRLNRLVRELRPDLIHCSLLDASLISRMVGRLTRTPVLESLVNISHEPIRIVDSEAVKLWKLRGYTALDRLTMRNVTAFHALTDEVARSWVDTIGLPPEKISVIPRGVSFDVIDSVNLDPTQRGELRRELIGDPDGVLILAVGREEPQKGHRYLLDAFAQVAANDLRVHLVMLGRPGSSSAALDAQVEDMGLDGRIHRLGVRSDVYRLMRAADLMVFPSLYEGMGVSLIEGMATALPVIVFDRPPMNQIVDHGKTGLFVLDRDPDALAAAIVSLVDDPRSGAMLGAEAARKIRATYDVEDTSRSLEHVYHVILEDGRSR